MRGEGHITISAPPEKLWRMVTDVTRMGEWSPETTSCEWLGGATGPAVGARFKGSNKAGPARWSTKPKVVECETNRAFAFDTGSTRWRYEFRPVDGGTEVVESFDVHTRPAQAFVVLTFRKGTLERGIQETLRRLKQKAEAAA